MPLNQVWGTECPNGSYCPTGTPSPVHCPKGTYQPSVHKARVEDCVGCDPGKFCSETGLSAVSDDCAAGFFCRGSANKSNPEDGVTGDICPVGSFCVKGSIQPHTCYNGTYMNHTGNMEVFLTDVLNDLNCFLFYVTHSKLCYLGLACYFLSFQTSEKYALML